MVAFSIFCWLVLSFIAWFTAVHLSNSGATLRAGKTPDVNWTEVFWCGITPVVGCIYVFIFKSDFKPFDVRLFALLMVLFIFYISCYWAVRLYLQQLAPEVIWLVSIGTVVGLFINLVLVIQFFSPISLLGIGLLPQFGFPLLAPGIFLIFQTHAIRQLKQHQRNAYMNPEASTARLPGWAVIELRKTPVFSQPMVYAGAVFFMIGCSLFFTIVADFPLLALVEVFDGDTIFPLGYLL